MKGQANTDGVRCPPYYPLRLAPKEMSDTGRISVSTTFSSTTLAYATIDTLEETIVTSDQTVNSRANSTLK